jgi:tetratricopeptide (TPR) repeat protein
MQASPGRLPPAAPPAGTVAADPPVQHRKEPAEKPIEGPARHRASAASQPRPRFPLALESFQAAVEYHLAGEFDRALDAYRALLARGELTAQVHNNLGLLYQSRGRLGEAAREFERSISADPRYPKAYNNSGVVLLAQGQIENAVRQFRTAASLDPRDPDPIVNLALAQKAAGQPERARESLLRALVLAPDGAPAHYNLAVLYDESGETARAAEHYKAFLASAGAEYQDRAADVRARLEAVEKILQ